MIEKIFDCPEDLKTEKGYGESIIADKCSSHWIDKECPNEATCQEYHWGQFGHKVLFLFCDTCYSHWLEFQKQWNGILDYSEDRGFEFIKSPN